MSVGVIVGRFQVDRPHQGHIDLINQVQKKHGKLMIGLGCAHLKLTKSDPLDYPTRERMFRKIFPAATVVPVSDMPSDKAWSHQLDNLIHQLFPIEASNGDVYLYGSRASFLPHYFGRFKQNLKELDTISVVSGTILRQIIGETVRDTPDFRAGVIYATQNNYIRSDQVVDVAIIGYGGRANFSDNTSVLMCRKKHDEPGKWAFVGGYVDAKDDTLEAAAVRELMEETGLEVSNVKYLGSTRIPDWRYRSVDDKMMSAFFVADYVFGHPEANDDIAEVKWVHVDQMSDHLLHHHKALGAMLLNHLSVSKGGQDNG